MHQALDTLLRSPWLAGLRAAFDRADTDGDGMIDAEDLRAALATLGLYAGESWCAQQIARFDQDGDGRCSFGDYVAGMVPAAAPTVTVAAEMMAAVGRADVDRDGRISVAELAMVEAADGQPVPMRQLADRVHAYDHDGDGRIDLGELLRMLVGD